MATSRFCLWFLCATLVLIPIDCYENDHVALFIFGDSFFDAGNNAILNALALTLNPPYGESFFEQPTGRACDGRLIPDFIAEYANLPLIPPYLQFSNSHKSIIKENLGLGEAGRVLQEMVIDFKIPRNFLGYSSNHSFENGVNFATGGAGALSETHQGLTIPLKTQLEYFTDVEKQLRLEPGDAKANKLLSKAVYMFSIGANDYFAATSEDETLLQRYTREEYVGMVIGNLTTVIQEIYKKGGRKFGFSTLQAIGCVPYLRAYQEDVIGEPGCLEEANLFAELHNAALPQALEELEGQLEGFKYSIFDEYKAGTERMSNPPNYGFENVTDACCGGGPYRANISCGAEGYQLCVNVREYMFFDAAHPTESSNNQFAQLMWDGGDDYTSPINLKSLFEEQTSSTRSHPIRSRKIKLSEK